MGHGELWCARLFTAVLKSLGNDAKFMDTRKVLTVVDASDGGVDVVYDTSNARLDAWQKEAAPTAASVIVATGFIAETPDGVPTTLRRNGSDYSATIMGALTRAGVITIWTDVDGVYSADPRKVPEAVCLEMLSYNEAWELSYFGANVLHPRTTLPAMKYSIPIYIRNFFNLGAKGTRISDVVDVPIPRGAGSQGAQGLVKGFATIENVTLINVEARPSCAAGGFSEKRRPCCDGTSLFLIWPPVSFRRGSLQPVCQLSCSSTRRPFCRAPTSRLSRAASTPNPTRRARAWWGFPEPPRTSSPPSATRG